MVPNKSTKKPPKALPKLIEKPLSKSKKKKNYHNYGKYLYKILKSVARLDTMGISKNSMLIMNSFVHDLLERIATEAGTLVSHSKSKTLSSRDIQSAVKLLIPGELAKHANIEGLKSVTMYHNSQEQK